MTKLKEKFDDFIYWITNPIVIVCIAVVLIIASTVVIVIAAEVEIHNPDSPISITNGVVVDKHDSVGSKGREYYELTIEGKTTSGLTKTRTVRTTSVTYSKIDVGDYYTVR
jgi:hypothetical protein